MHVAVIRVPFFTFFIGGGIRRQGLQRHGTLTGPMQRVVRLSLACCGKILVSTGTACGTVESIFEYGYCNADKSHFHFH